MAETKTFSRNSRRLHENAASWLLLRSKLWVAVCWERGGSRVGPCRTLLAGKSRTPVAAVTDLPEGGNGTYTIGGRKGPPVGDLVPHTNAPFEPSRCAASPALMSDMIPFAKSWWTAGAGGAEA